MGKEGIAISFISHSRLHSTSVLSQNRTERMTRRDTEENDGKAFILGWFLCLPLPFLFPYLSLSPFPAIPLIPEETKEWMGNYMEREGRRERKERDG